MHNMSRYAETINSVPMHDADIKATAEWLADGARSAPQPQQVLSQLCERLLACGIPLWRVAVFIRTLHPNVMGRRFVWRPGAEVETSEAPFELLASADFLENPVARVYQTSHAIRRKLSDPDCTIDFPILTELRAEGVTDYLAVPLLFTDGAIHVVTCTTRQSGGFTDGQIAGIDAIIAPLTRVAEIRMLRRMASILLDTYVGRSPGERILAGHIRRGDIEEIHAAIWLSDMRGFTALADRVPPRQLIDLLNRYFDCQVPADPRSPRRGAQIYGRRVVGDISDCRRQCRCRRSLLPHACRRARVRTNVAALSEEIGPEDLGALRFGLALHVGEVLYGNIGSGNRLDFTCIGPAVNLAARIEKLTGQLGRVILASEDFARQCPQDFSLIGQFNLAGFGAPQLVFGLEDEISRQ